MVHDERHHSTLAKMRTCQKIMCGPESFSGELQAIKGVRQEAKFSNHDGFRGIDGANNQRPKQIHVF